MECGSFLTRLIIIRTDVGIGIVMRDARNECNQTFWQNRLKNNHCICHTSGQPPRETTANSKQNKKSIERAIIQSSHSDNFVFFHVISLFLMKANIEGKRREYNEHTMTEKLGRNAKQKKIV